MTTVTLNETRPDAARRIASVCSTNEAERVKSALHERIADADRAELLWLTWVQWRAMGREAMVRETGLSLWTVTCRLRQLREAGVPIPSWTRELDLLARGQFHGTWEQEWPCRHGARLVHDQQIRVIHGGDAHNKSAGVPADCFGW